MSRVKSAPAWRSKHPVNQTVLCLRDLHRRRAVFCQLRARYGSGNTAYRMFARVLINNSVQKIKVSAGDAQGNTWCLVHAIHCVCNYHQTQTLLNTALDHGRTHLATPEPADAYHYGVRSPSHFILLCGLSYTMPKKGWSSFAGTNQFRCRSEKLWKLLPHSPQLTLSVSRSQLLDLFVHPATRYMPGKNVTQHQHPA